MALSFKDRETNALARKIASVPGETLTLAITRLLAERLQRRAAFIAPKRLRRLSRGRAWLKVDPWSRQLPSPTASAPSSTSSS